MQTQNQPPTTTPPGQIVDLVESAPGSGVWEQRGGQSKRAADTASAPAAASGQPDAARCSVCARETDEGVMMPFPMVLIYPEPVPLCSVCQAAGNVTYLYLRDNVLNPPTPTTPTRSKP